MEKIAGVNVKKIKPEDSSMIMTKIGQHHYGIGQSVKMLENGEVIDEGILKKIGTGGDPKRFEIEFESKKLYPNSTEEFVFFPSNDEKMAGWRVLFKDPMGYGRCYSKRGPLYVFLPS